MMFRRRIAAVSYLNTVPLIYGIERAGQLRAELHLAPPAQCFLNFESGFSDIALIPSGTLPQIEHPQIITDYCIGAHGPVRTVAVLSNAPLSELETIYMDPHSRTSVLLTQILAKEKWNISPRFVPLSDYSVMGNQKTGDGFLVIGDKVFGMEDKFEFKYDLAEEWIEHTSLPFVFAVWVGRNVDHETERQLNMSFRYGISHIKESATYYGHSQKPYAMDYLTNNIDFNFDSDKRDALELFRWEMQEPGGSIQSRLKELINGSFIY